MTNSDKRPKRKSLEFLFGTACETFATLDLEQYPLSSALAKKKNFLAVEVFAQQQATLELSPVSIKL